jgi:competence CoiA-like predicted nuclease
VEQLRIQDWERRCDPQSPKKQLQLNEEARLKVARKKNEIQSKTLDKAQLALKKYRTDQNTLNEKDWGDVIRWVLPEAKVTFLLKDLKKKEQIHLKLATLPNHWTSYIPVCDDTADIPTTTV